MAKRGRGESITSKRRLAAAKRQAEALQLRSGGAGFAQVAAELGYTSPARAFEAVNAALDATLREPAEKVRELEADRLDRLQSAHWGNAMLGDQNATAVVLKIMERRARLLGL